MENPGREEVKLGDASDLDHRWTPESVRLLLELIGLSKTRASIACAAVFALATLPAQCWNWIDCEPFASLDTVAFVSVIEHICLSG